MHAARGAKPAIPPAGICGRPSLCRPHYEFVMTCLESGLTAQRIFQDLQIDHGFAGAYDSVKRYVRRTGVNPGKQGILTS
jgi:hypothetical protein